MLLGQLRKGQHIALGHNLHEFHQPLVWCPHQHPQDGFRHDLPKVKHPIPRQGRQRQVNRQGAGVINLIQGRVVDI